jgi:hypothetical protein
MPKAIACVNFKTDMNWGYIEGFRKSADILAKQIFEVVENPDYLIYPLGFLYHQHIELQLKWLIDLAAQLLNEKGRAPHTHDLTKLWKQLQIKLIQIEPAGEQFVQELDDLIADICVLDHTGEQFRYQSLSDGKISFESTHFVDIEEFALKRIAISDDLQAIRMTLSVKKDELVESMLLQLEER